MPSQRPKSKKVKTKWGFLKHPLLVGCIVAVIGLVGVLLKKNSSNFSATNGPVANSNSVSVFGNNSGQIAGGNLINTTTVINSNIIAPVIVMKVVETEALEFRQKQEGVFLLFGGNTIGLPTVPSGQIAKKDIGRAFLGAGTYENPSRIELIATDKQIAFNIEFVPVFGMPPLKLKDNELSGLPSNWDCNHSKRGIEVVNERLTPVFQLYYKDDSHIVFNGVITFTNGAVFIAEGKGQSLELNSTFSEADFFNRVEALEIKRIFKYPAWQHPGEFADR